MSIFGGLFRLKRGTSHQKRNDVVEHDAELDSHLKLATFGAGCFWGTEKYFTKDFTKKHPQGIHSSSVGFMSSEKNAVDNPTYYQVCSGVTGHVEVCELVYDSRKIEYEDLCRFFFTFHDCTQYNRQGNDKGPQYASVIFVHDDEQMEIARKVKDELQKRIDDGKIKGFQEDKVRTKIARATVFYKAEDEHQQYLALNPSGYCNHRIRFSW
eukprot:CAMPEP_0182442084 /NCGR_PEP_ID=MMETSP1172-20130603/1048_1 /TAXON_ID=708627 /ORGANISM="Timspurckia oligopyrenoides, Strain CCMP3278" /LENGTH=210 /DNA_ID=CAMNT_0024636779 /DNA_START=177 /DNA_END=809 /DNA_ORIENTATION=+